MTQQPASKKLSGRTLSRLPQYLHYLETLHAEGLGYVTSAQLATALGCSDALTRKDVAALGHSGRSGQGYSVEALRYTIARILGVTSGRRVLLVGAGNLGAALMSYEGFAERGMNITAVADNDPTKIGQRYGGYTILDIHDIGTDHDMELAIVTVPGEVAQDVTDLLVNAGITGILNFAPRRLHVPEHVHVQTVDLSAELQILAFQRDGA
ncbi:MAG: redox-sensing transcriptional repressor Rex [Micrococcaceae bacterium]|nr:redox-sensing transcriptional repressor Rex [Micrococcaceae bacterium]